MIVLAVDVAVRLALILCSAKTYGSCCTTAARAVVVDPAVAPAGDPRAAGPARLELEAVLQTHSPQRIHIRRHPGALLAPKMAWAPRWIAAAVDASASPFQTTSLNGGERLTLLRSHHQCWQGRPTPALNLGYVLPAVARRSGELFCRRHAVRRGCGRLFEGRPEQHAPSLQSPCCPARRHPGLVCRPRDTTLANLRVGRQRRQQLCARPAGRDRGTAVEVNSQAPGRRLDHSTARSPWSAPTNRFCRPDPARSCRARARRKAGS